MPTGISSKVYVRKIIDRIIKIIIIIIIIKPELLVVSCFMRKTNLLYPQQRISFAALLKFDCGHLLAECPVQFSSSIKIYCKLRCSNRQIIAISQRLSIEYVHIQLSVLS